jgi:NitT/TauT family transport system permease protein
MADLTAALPDETPSLINIRKIAAIVLALAAGLVALSVAAGYATLTADDPALVDSTFGQLAVWMAEQSEEEAPVSLFGQWAKSWAASRGEETLDEAAAVTSMRWPVVIVAAAAAVCVAIGSVVQLRGGTRRWWLFALGFAVALLFLIPVGGGRELLTQAMLCGVLLIFALSVTPGTVSRSVGFVVVLAALLIGVEAMKGFAASTNYKIVIPEAGWNYSTYPTLDDALAALQNGEIRAVIADENDLEELFEAEEAEPRFPDVQLVENLTRDETRLGLPVQPALPARFGLVVREEDAGTVGAVSQLLGDTVGTVAGDPAETNFLSLPRAWQLIDLRIFNNLNMPHLQAIASAFLQPARRNGPVLLARILAGNAVYTWSEAALGFAAGATLGFVLGAVFAHSKLLERGLLPYVVASQTVPILAIAPMVVIWLGAGPIAVAVISAYLTFFPVTINTLRGLTSPNPIQVDLMRSYAASRWTIFTKLRLPAAVPYIFTALKVSATASVVGAVIGELPSSIRDGLARAILDFSSSYSEISTPKLYAAIVSAALVGILFFTAVSLVERVAMRRYIPHSE